jgi:hypothetical protein
MSGESGLLHRSNCYGGVLIQRIAVIWNVVPSTQQAGADETQLNDQRALLVSRLYARFWPI